MIAPIIIVVGACAVMVYLASCSSGKKPAPSHAKASRQPALNKVASHIPEPPPPPAPEPEPQQDDDKPATLVKDVLTRGCSTTIVKGLSEQIIAEGNCMQPGAYVKLSPPANVTFGRAVFPYLTQDAHDALLDAVDDASKRKLTINSMLRTVAQQYLLYGWYKRGRCGIKLAAVPGKSNHETGLALDVAQPRAWRKTLSRYGYRWFGKRDRWHFDYVDDDAKKRRGLDIKAFQRLWNRNHPGEAIRADGDWGEGTEEALLASPIGGFAKGASCSTKDPDSD